jgi:hypothetical protein
VVNRGAPLLSRCRAALLAAALGCTSPALVRPASVEPAGAVLRYDGPAEAVYLRGSMTGWEPVPFAPDASGFALTLRLPAGRYEYHLELHRAGAIQIVVPRGAERADDGFGGENAILRVP